jgi:hypothetical protein
MSMNHIRLYDLFRRELHLSDDKAADFVMESIRKEIQQSKEDTYKAIFLAGFFQFIAILGSVLAIIKFMK